MIRRADTMRSPPAGRTARYLSALVGLAALLVPLASPAATADPVDERVRRAPSTARNAEPAAGAPAEMDFDGDDYDDLVVGTPNSLYVLYGSAVGLNPERRQILSVSAVAGPRATGPEANFGGSSTTADFDGDTYTELGGLD